MSHATHTAELERRLMGFGLTGPDIRAIREAHGVAIPEPEPNAMSEVLTSEEV